MDDGVGLDFYRMFIGTDAPSFYLEIFIRIAVIWTWTMLLLRWVGGRSVSQLSLVEFLLVIALGTAVGDALFYPEVPLLQAMFVIFVVICYDKLIDLLIRHFSAAKMVIDGQPIVALRDGVICTSRLGASQIGSLELMELLRLKGVENLGSVRHAFLEPSGQLSVFGADPPRRGLQIVPPLECLGSGAADAAATTESAAPKRDCCSNCGMVEAEASECRSCHSRDRCDAVQAPKLP